MEDENPAELVLVVDRRLLREGGSAVSAVDSSPIRTSVSGTAWQNLDGLERVDARGISNKTDSLSGFAAL